MKTKDQLRKKFFTLRKKKYFSVAQSHLGQLVDYIKKKVKQRKIILLRYIIHPITKLTYLR